MYSFNSIKLKNLEKIVSQMSYGTSRGPAYFYHICPENHKIVLLVRELGITYRNLVCLSLIFETITII